MIFKVVLKLASALPTHLGYHCPSPTHLRYKLIHHELLQFPLYRGENGAQQQDKWQQPGLKLVSKLILQTLELEPTIGVETDLQQQARF